MEWMNPYYSQATVNVQSKNYSNQTYLAWTQNGYIYRDTGSGPEHIGVTTDLYNELETTASGYRDRLIELGEIEIPLTQEQINEKLMSELKAIKEERTELTSLIKTLANKLEVKNGPEKPNSGSNDGSTSSDINSNFGTGEDEQVVSYDQ